MIGAQNTRVKSILIAGMQGYYAGPDVHFIDEMALCDALLARLPIEDTQHWRIGHMHRAVPAGYDETISTGRNYLADPDLARYYDKLALIIREDVFASDRLATIWKMNTGQYEYLLRSATSR